ncbi:MAG: hypothetical protein QM756_29140 [Polyangiaceae bacterium]
MKASMPLTDDAIRLFASTLPESYRNNFEIASIGQHARIALERESAPPTWDCSWAGVAKATLSASWPTTARGCSRRSARRSSCAGST